jgi:predicted kinase
LAIDAKGCVTISANDGNNKRRSIDFARLKRIEIQMNTAQIHIVFGHQGAGKSTYARELADKFNATRFSIDEWMGELFGPDMPQPLSFKWVMERVQRCEQRIWNVAAQIAQRDGTVVLDLGFMKVSDRNRFVALAVDAGLTTQLHQLTAAHALRRRRVLERNVSKGETFSFEVSPAMFDFMEKQFESPTDLELATLLLVKTD